MSGRLHYQPRPTSYAGNSFRSRLEARWAAFFDFVGWRWTYEPIDGVEWCPDFLIHGVTPLYAEVKPLTEFSPGEWARLPGFCGSLPRCEPLLLAASPFEGESGPAIGWLGQRFDPEWFPAELNVTRTSFDPGDATLCRYSYHPERVPVGPRRIGLAHAYQSFTDRITGKYDGGTHGDVEWAEVARLWAEAGNATRWNAR